LLKMKNNSNNIHGSDDDNYSDAESSSLLGNGHRPVPAKKEWDVFSNTPPVILTGSMADQTCIKISLKIVKLLAYIITFICVLGGSVVSKGTVLFMTSQLRENRYIPYCNATIEKQREFTVTLPEVERVGWFWCLFFAYIVPEIMTFFRSMRMCFFKNTPKPRLYEFMVVAVPETLHAVGTGILIFLVFPHLDVIKAAMLTNCVCFVPGVLGLLRFIPYFNQDKKQGLSIMDLLKLFLNMTAVAAQITGFVVWPLLENNLKLWMIPVAVALISCGWWENFMPAAEKYSVRDNFMKRLKDTRYYTYMYVSVWKILCMFGTMLVISFVEYDMLGNLFDMFVDTFNARNINVTEVLSYNNSGLPNRGDAVSDVTNWPVEASYNSALWVLLIHVLASYISYITGKFACKILIQSIGFALPVNLAVPVVITLLVTLCGLRNGDPCYFRDIIPDYLFFNSPNYYLLDSYLANDYAWIWLLWLLSQTWISIHIWMPKVDRLMSTEMLFNLPMYDSLLMDQSLAFNRKHDDGFQIDSSELDEVWREEEYAQQHRVEEEEAGEKNNPEREADRVRRVYACATMWHETPDEMMQMLKSIFRMDADQCARRIAQKHMKIVDPDYYEFETNIFFDDAFVLRKPINDEDIVEDVVVNDFVIDFVNTIGKAAREVHGTEVLLKSPVKYPTPYGGRLVWTLPGKTKLVVHLKDKDKIRHKKRWSQVMYMYYLLGHRLMELSINSKRKAVIARNTFILALDGDIDFKPEAVLLLLDLMKKDPNLGAACGRIHPVGSGAMVWYQIFEYAIGHWMQKATEHVIGCVLCSPGCFSLFRGEALMDDAVMNKYTTTSSEAKDFVQYDQGEDRWLCTLLLQRGYRVEYSAASDAYTHCPEEFDEFYNQRRRWVPSTMANIFDLLGDYKRTVKVNDNISFIYIVYQIVLMVGSILGPGSIFLMLVGAFVSAFKIDNWTSFSYNIIPVLTFMFVCFVCKSNVQLFFAKVISAIYGLVMMAVLVGIMLQINEDGPLAPSSLFFFMVAAEMVIAAFLHPQEFYCLPAGIIYYVTIPSMYLLLIVYSIFNLNNVSWGTREVPVQLSKAEMERKRKEEENAKKNAKKDNAFMSFLRKEKEGAEEEGSFELQFAGLFKCMLCTYPKASEEKVQLMRIADSIERVSRKIENIERNPSPRVHAPGRRRTTVNLNKKDLESLAEDDEEETSDQDTDPYTENTVRYKGRRDEVNPFWIDYHEELRKGGIEFLGTREKQFWRDLIDKYLFVLIKEEKLDKIILSHIYVFL
ncbi:hypothetical protein L9F63_006188, partial [Diploptera punctata]